MKRIIGFVLVLVCTNVYGQQVTDSMNQNTADRLLGSKTKLSIGGYAQLDYNQEVYSDSRQAGNIDVHRMVLMFGYKFNNRTNFITEIEMEHVKELYVEQAFLQYRISNSVNLRAGLMLVPMGIVNEYHEPTTYNGVERPDVDKYVVPSTWRENGIGLSGNLRDINLKYQAYIFNGFSGHTEDEATFSAKNGLRKGRQKGAEAYMSSPTFSSKVDYYGIKGLKLGLAGYFGRSQTRYYDGVPNSGGEPYLTGDSTVVDINMVGVNAIYTYKGLQLKGQFNSISLGNTDQYNAFFGSDLGSNILGYYGEVSYNLFRGKSQYGKLLPFFRYERFNTHNKVEGDIVKQEEYNRSSMTFGLGWKPNPGAIYKADFQFYTHDGKGAETTNQLNMGVGVWF